MPLKGGKGESTTILILKTTRNRLAKFCNKFYTQQAGDKTYDEGINELLDTDAAMKEIAESGKTAAMVGKDLRENLKARDNKEVGNER